MKETPENIPFNFVLQLFTEYGRLALEEVYEKPFQVGADHMTHFNVSGFFTTKTVFHHFKKNDFFILDSDVPDPRLELPVRVFLRSGRWKKIPGQTSAGQVSQQ